MAKRNPVVTWRKIMDRTEATRAAIRLIETGHGFNYEPVGSGEHQFRVATDEEAIAILTHYGAQEYGGAKARGEG